MNDEYRERLIHEIMGCLQELYPDFMYNMTIQDTLDLLELVIKLKQEQKRENRRNENQ